MMVIALDATRRARGLPPARPDRSVAVGAAVFVAGWSEGAWAHVTGHMLRGSLAVACRGETRVLRRDEVEPLRQPVRQERVVERSTGRLATALASAHPAGSTWLVRFDEGGDAIVPLYELRPVGKWEPVFAEAVPAGFEDDPEAA